MHRLLSLVAPNRNTMIHLIDGICKWHSTVLCCTWLLRVSRYKELQLEKFH